MNPIERAISYMGNASRLAEALGCSLQAVCFWRDGKRKIDAETAMLIERVTHRAVTCEELCPGVDWAYIRGSKKRLKAYPGVVHLVADPLHGAKNFAPGTT